MEERDKTIEVECKIIETERTEPIVIDVEIVETGREPIIIEVLHVDE